jgi:hypothetical protein
LRRAWSVGRRAFFGHRCSQSRRQPQGQWQCHGVGRGRGGAGGDARFEVRGASFEVRGRGKRSRVAAWFVKRMSQRPSRRRRALRTTLSAPRSESSSRFTRDAFAVVN